MQLTPRVLLLIKIGFFIIIFTGCLYLLFTQKDAEAQYRNRNYYEQRYNYGPIIIRPLPTIDRYGPSIPTFEQPKFKDVQPIQLDVYYETNCPDSMRFITQQLFPLYKEMKDVIKIRLVPFGKATAEFNEVSKLYDFQCHHGPPECYGNTVQSCAISLYPNPEDYLNYVNCMEEYPRPSTAALKCARRNSLDWNKIVKCAEGEEGNRLLYENSKLTKSLNPEMNFVPWIVVNNVYTPEQQRKSLRNLKQVVCDNIRNQHSKCTIYS